MSRLLEFKAVANKLAKEADLEYYQAELVIARASNTRTMPDLMRVLKVNPMLPLPTPENVEGTLLQLRFFHTYSRKVQSLNRAFEENRDKILMIMEEFYQRSREDKQQHIERELELAGNPVKELERAVAISSIINTFINDYIDHKSSKMLKTWDSKKQNELIKEKMEQFWPDAKSALKLASDDSKVLGKNSNIYEFFGASKLTFSNKVIRSLNAKMGFLWEEVASISPYAINPEIEFGIKIKGIDLIAKNIITGKIEYIQVKTQQNTLTGSQVPRSNIELNLHENPVFAACFSLNSWTFSPENKVTRVSGADFWSRVGMDYELVCNQAKTLIMLCEKEYITLLNQ